METVPYMEKGIVIPVHNVVLLPGVSTMIYYSQASVQLQEALRQEDAKFVVWRSATSPRKISTVTA